MTEPLLMTDAERAAASWMNLDDATVGRLTKRYGAMFIKSAAEREITLTQVAALFLVDFAVQQGSGLELVLEGFSIEENELGDWKVSVRQVEASPRLSPTKPNETA